MRKFIYTKRIISIIVLISICCTGCYSSSWDLKTINREEDTTEKLWAAVMTKTEQALIEAIREGADINKFERNNNGTISPLIEACHTNCSNRFIKTILEYGVDPNFVDVSGQTVFAEAIHEKDFVYNKLLESNPNVNYKDHSGRSVLNYAIYDGYINTKRVKDLLDRGALVSSDEIDVITERINNHVGYEIGVIPCVNVLKMFVDNYDGKIDKDIKAAYTGTFSKDNKCDSNIILYGIAGYCNQKTLSENLKKDNDLEIDLNVLLRIAVMAGNIENTKFLIEKGANMVDHTEDGIYGNALEYAIEYNEYDVAPYVMAINRRCLIAAVENNNIDFVKLLIQNGASINNKEAFECAYRYGYKDIVKYFIDNGFILNTTNYMNTYNYNVAIFESDNIDIVRYVHQYCNKLNHDELKEAMIITVENGNLELLKYLKELNADFSDDYVLSDGSRYDSQLCTAVIRGYLNIVEYLVENGSNASKYSEEELNHLIGCAKCSDDIYKYLTSKNII